MLNTRAPEFSLESSTGQQVTLHDLLGSFVVLIFYPINDTPICNSQLKEASLNLQQFLEVNARVFGINTAAPAKQREYCMRKKLDFPILSDPGGKVAKKFKAHMVWLPFNLRTVVVVDPQGEVCYFKRGKPSAHEILEAINAQSATLRAKIPDEAG